jgi:hypothetical protein
MRAPYVEQVLLAVVLLIHVLLLQPPIIVLPVPLMHQLRLVVLLASVVSVVIVMVLVPVIMLPSLVSMLVSKAPVLSPLLFVLAPPAYIGNMVLNSAILVFGIQLVPPAGPVLVVVGVNPPVPLVFVFLVQLLVLTVLFLTLILIYMVINV